MLLNHTMSINLSSDTLNHTNVKASCLQFWHTIECSTSSNSILRGDLICSTKFECNSTKFWITTLMWIVRSTYHIYIYKSHSSFIFWLVFLFSSLCPVTLIKIYRWKICIALDWISKPPDLEAVSLTTRPGVQLSTTVYNSQHIHYIG